MAKQYSQAEVDALLARATGGSDLDATAARPYHTIVHEDGQLLSAPPPEGPLTINGRHPDDYYNVVKDDKGNVKLNAAGQATMGDAIAPAATPAAPATAPTAAATPADDEDETQEQKDAAELAAFRADKAAAAKAAGGSN